MAEADNIEKKTRTRKPRAVKTIDVEKETKQVKEKPAPKEKAPAKPKTTTKKADDNKLTKEQAAKKVNEAKELSDLINTLKEKNTPTSEKAAVKMAKDTIKLVTEAQKSGSLAFKRESTKALVQIRSAIEKIPFAKDDAKEKLIADLDSVVLDVKNVTLYMKSLAKAQIKLMQEQAAEDVRSMKQDSANKARLLRSQALAESKKIKKQAHEESKQLTAQTVAENKVARANQIARIKGIRQSLSDRAKEIKDKQEQRDLDHAQKVADQKASIKKQRAESAAQAKKIRGDLMQRRQKQNDDIKLRKLEVKQELVKGREDIKLMKKNNKLKVDQLYRDLRREAKERKLREAKEKRNKFLDEIKEGVYEANPLLELGVKVFKGMKSFFDVRKEKKESQNRQNKLKKQISGSQLGSRNYGLQSGNVPTGATGAKAGNVAPTAASSGGGVLDGLMNTVSGIVSGVGSFLSGIARFGGKLLPVISKGLRAVPIIGMVATAFMTIFDFAEGFSNADKLFGEKDPSFLKKTFAGFVNVFSSIVGLIDNIAGWLGFDTKLKEGFEKGAVELYNGVTNFFSNLAGTVSKWWEEFDLSKSLSSAGETILGAGKMLMNALLVPYRYLADKFAGLMTKIPGIGDDNSIVKMLREFGSGGAAKTENISNPNHMSSGQVTTKKREVEDLYDKIEEGRAAGAKATVAIDNSTKSNNTTIITQKMSTRNEDSSAARYGYPNAFNNR